MIKSLYLKNFALFDEININFENGLNIITGETGSGKSLLLKSLKSQVIFIKIQHDFY